jgi:hypothetical protein
MQVFAFFPLDYYKVSERGQEIGNNLEHPRAGTKGKT